MQQNKLVVGAGILILALSAGWVGGSFNKPTDTYTQVVKELQPIVQQLGSMVGPEDPNPYHCTSGVCEYFYSATVKTATSTVCAFRSPAATTTIGTLPTVQFTSAIGYTTGWLWGYSASTQNSTSSALGSLNSLTSPAENATIVASSTVQAIPPRTYFSLNLSTSTAGVNANFSPAGFCQMSLITFKNN